MDTTRNYVLRSVYVSPELDDQLRDKAYQERLSKNELIRRYIELGVQLEAHAGSLKDIVSNDKLILSIAKKVAASKSAASSKSKVVAKKVATTKSGVDQSTAGRPRKVVKKRVLRR